jgi:hypothetical protein
VLAVLNCSIIREITVEALTPDFYSEVPFSKEPG